MPVVARNYEIAVGLVLQYLLNQLQDIKESLPCVCSLCFTHTQTKNQSALLVWVSCGQEASYLRSVKLANGLALVASGTKKGGGSEVGWWQRTDV